MDCLTEVWALTMSHWRSGWIKRGENSFHLARSRRRCDAWCGGENPNESLGSPRSFLLRIADFTALCALAFVCWGLEISRAQVPDPETAIYARSVEYCRGNVKRPMALDLDKRVLCFDGAILSGLSFSLASTLQVNGLFVVRSSGGEAAAAMALADLIQDRHATVVVYDYCLSACASYFLVASDAAFVLRILLSHGTIRSS